MSDNIYQLLDQTFEWDPAKARKNWLKHRILFTEAATVFFDPEAIYYEDPDHSELEQRYIVIGRSRRDQRLFVVHVYREERIRIISARQPTARERNEYESRAGR